MRHGGTARARSFDPTHFEKTKPISPLAPLFAEAPQRKVLTKEPTPRAEAKTRNDLQQSSGMCRNLVLRCCGPIVKIKAKLQK
jgi:hypothetical protein